MAKIKLYRCPEEDLDSCTGCYFNGPNKCTRHKSIVCNAHQIFRLAFDDNEYIEIEDNHE